MKRRKPKDYLRRALARRSASAEEPLSPKDWRRLRRELKAQGDMSYIEDQTRPWKFNYTPITAPPRLRESDPSHVTRDAWYHPDTAGLTPFMRILAELHDPEMLRFFKEPMAPSVEEIRKEYHQPYRLREEGELAGEGARGEECLHG